MPNQEDKPGQEAADRQMMEQELRTTVQRLEYILAATHTNIDVIDASFVLRYVDPAWQKIYGDPAGRKCHEYFMGRDTMCDGCGIPRALATKQVNITREVLPRENNRHIEVHTIPFQESDGEWLVAEFNIDITERQRTEAVLARLASAVEQSADGISVVDMEGFVQYANHAWAEMHGYEQHEMIGRHLGMFHTAQQLEAEVRPFLVKILAAVGSHHGEVGHMRKDGSTFPTLMTVSVLRAQDGSPTGMVGTARDITERKEAEAQRIELERRLLHAQKLESLGVLAGGIAHDFNNLLMAVLGNLDLSLLCLPREAPARACVEQAILATRKATDLTAQMLAYSGKGRYVLSCIDINDLARENVELLRTAIPRNVAFRLEPAREACRIEADPAQVQQVVMNLITNAAEAIGRDDGAITMTTGIADCNDDYLAGSLVDPRPGHGRYAYVEIADTGCGMDEATIQKLFDPFFSTKFTGRGLGMCVVHGIVRGHGGAMMLATGPGQGTTVRVLFPESARQETPVAAAAPTADAQLPPCSGTVLVADDEAPVRQVAMAFVRRLGFDAIGAANGEEAVALFGKHAGATVLVLLDLTMPRMGGLAAFRMIKQIRSDVPVILCSGYSETEAIEQFSNEGLAGFLQKPYRLHVLREMVVKLLGCGPPPGSGGGNASG